MPAPGPLRERGLAHALMLDVSLQAHERMNSCRISRSLVVICYGNPGSCAHAASPKRLPVGCWGGGGWGEAEAVRARTTQRGQGTCPRALSSRPRLAPSPRMSHGDGQTTRGQEPVCWALVQLSHDAGQLGPLWRCHGAASTTGVVPHSAGGCTSKAQVSEWQAPVRPPLPVGRLLAVASRVQDTRPVVGAPPARPRLMRPPLRGLAPKHHHTRAGASEPGQGHAHSVLRAVWLQARLSASLGPLSLLVNPLHPRCPLRRIVRD